MLPNAWIFHANPKKYYLREALAAHSRLRWSVRQERDDIRKGDRLYLWEGGANPGIVAVGIIVSDPMLLAETPHEQQYWCGGQPAEFAGKQLRVRIKISRVLPRSLSKDELKQDATLRKLKIVKMKSARETNYHVTTPQMWRLDKLIATIK